jgi:hypothetical protein
VKNSLTIISRFNSGETTIQVDFKMFMIINNGKKISRHKRAGQSSMTRHLTFWLNYVLHFIKFKVILLKNDTICLKSEATIFFDKIRIPVFMYLYCKDHTDEVLAKMNKCVPDMPLNANHGINVGLVEIASYLYMAVSFELQW